MTSLHSSFMSLTGFIEPWKLGYTDYAWGKWKLAGKDYTDPPREWNESDLRLVVDMLKRVWKDKPYTLQCLLKFRKLIVDADVPGSTFAENWQTATALQRSKPTQRDKALLSMGRPEPLRAAVTAAVALERSRLADMLKRYRENL